MIDPFLICLLSSILFHIAAMDISIPKPYETDKMCISGSSVEILNGDYEWILWDRDIKGSKYYKSSYNKYLYPYIKSDGSYRYYINSDGNGTMVNAYCSINNPPSNYFFNVEDCIGNWYIASGDSFVEDLNMISTNCQEICISGDYRDNLDGVYFWHHFNPTTSSSVYQCQQCQTYLFLWQFSNGLAWRIGPDYSDPGAWSSCHFDENGIHHQINGNYFPELCDITTNTEWYSWYDDTWNVNTMSVEKCDVTTTTTTTTTTTKKAISYDSRGSHYYDDDSDDDSDDSEFIFLIVGCPLGACIFVMFLYWICAKKKHDEPVEIYNHNTNQIQKEPVTVQMTASNNPYQTHSDQIQKEPVTVQIQTTTSNNPYQTYSEPGQTEGFSNIEMDINNIDVDIKGNDIAQNEVVKTVVEKVVDVVVDEVVDEVAGEVVNAVVEEVFDGVVEAVVEVVVEEAAEVVKDEIKNQVVSFVFGFL